MGDTLVATIEQRRSGARLIKFVGAIDEQNELAELVEKVGPGTALINLAGVERISSTGARDWINWLATLEAKGTRPVLIACSPAVVEHLNSNKNFAGSAVVKSFHVPYECTSCTRDKLLLVHVIDMPDAPYSAPPCTCDACGSEMEFVNESGTYFAFLSQLPKPKPETRTDSQPAMARGSNADGTLTAEQVQRISQPRLTPRGSRQSLSSFQIPYERKSASDITQPRPPMSPPHERPYMIAIILLLLCTVAVLGFLLLV
ncbi:MAG TPA: STAS domain-containing protein [Kofleriaceae bacterium]